MIKEKKYITKNKKKYFLKYIYLIKINNNKNIHIKFILFFY